MNIDWYAISSDQEEENYADDVNQTREGFYSIPSEQRGVIKWLDSKRTDISRDHRRLLCYNTDPIDIEVYELTKKAIYIAKSNMLLTFRDILTQALQDTNCSSAAKNAIEPKNLSQLIKRARQAANNYPRILVDPARLVLSEVWRNLSDGSPFVIYDSGPAIEDWQGPHQRYIILSSAGCMEDKLMFVLLLSMELLKPAAKALFRIFVYMDKYMSNFVPMGNVLMTRRRMNMDYREHKDAGGNKFNHDETLYG
uniref:Uncharacterized protein n=1 Tax=Ditylenchus dipsaci TaxID=166011 RepID=A0A915ET62_9BILA